ncbi:uncharacterized protein JCM6883_007552 [Sporobolomyces salmoneus]|uniref:uncharacterized protein n=1 Tax=Sporobolomyces salmoneus TaxID=183962 RepID=UPI003178E89F
MPIDTHVKRAHPILFGLLILFTLVGWAMCAAVTNHYNGQDWPSNSIRDRVRFLLFANLWTFVFAIIYLVGFLKATGSFLFSIASHAVIIFLSWVFMMSGVAALTQSLGGGLNCNTFRYAYCGVLNGIEGISWLNWIILTILLVMILVQGSRAGRSGNGFGGALVEV